MIEPQLEYRTIRDNLSQFTYELNRANSLTDIQLLLQNSLRYLFSCCVCRITYFQQNNFVCYTLTNDTPAVVTGTYQLLWDVEKLLFYEGLPLRLNIVEHASILQNLPHKNEIDKLWGWKLNYSEDAGILLTILASEERPFSRKHIPMVKMLCEMLFTKIRLILLLQNAQRNDAELIFSNNHEEANYATIRELIKMHEKIINKRPDEFTHLNKKLVELIQFNSHTIREPLTRIMGLMQLKSLVSDEEFSENCWPMLVSSVQDLDNRLKEIIVKTERI